MDRGEIEVTDHLLYALSCLYEACEAASKDAPSLRLLKSEVRSLLEGRAKWYWNLLETHSDSVVRNLASG